MTTRNVSGIDAGPAANITQITQAQMSGTANYDSAYVPSPSDYIELTKATDYNDVSVTLATLAEAVSGVVLTVPAGATAETINAALSKAATLGGGTVQLEAGNYSGLTAYISIPSNVTLKGAGMDVTILSWAAGATSNDPDSHGWVTMAGVTKSRVLDLTVDLSAVTGGGDGIVMAPTAVGSIPNSISCAVTTTGIAVSAASKANPCIITTAGNALDNCSWVCISGVTGTGWTGLNGNIYPIQKVTTTTYRLMVDSSGFGTFGGTVLAAPCFQHGELVTQTTSGATATVIYAKGAAGDSTGSISLYGINGTFDDTNVITGSLSGTTVTSSSTLQNIAAQKCRIDNCKVIGRASTVQYLIWSRQAMDSIVTGCVVDGQTIADAGFAYDTAGVDQAGIEVYGGYNVKFLNNTARNCAGNGIACIVASGATSICTENVLISGNTIERCSAAIAAVSSYTAPNIGQLRNVIIDRNNIVNPCRSGLLLGHTSTIAAVVSNNVIVSNNTVDCRGSKRSSTYGVRPLLILTDTSGALWNGCKVSRNVFTGGGGKGATTTMAGASYLLYANDWELDGNTFDSVIDTNTTSNLECDNCVDLKITSNVFSNVGKRAISLSTCVGAIFDGNFVYGNPTLTAGFTALAEFKNTCTNLQITNNVFDAPATSGALVGGGTGTYVKIRGNSFLNGTTGIYQGSGASLWPWADESATASNGTFTHLQGTFAPADGSGTFIVNQRDIAVTSKINITQLAGTPAPVTVTLAVGKFTLTGSFAASCIFSYEIVN
jgi:Right handed beta helix region